MAEIFLYAILEAIGLWKVLHLDLTIWHTGCREMATASLPTLRAISPLKEMGAYEALWAKPDTTFASLAAKFREHPGYLPSDFVTAHDEAKEAIHDLQGWGIFDRRNGEFSSGVDTFGVAWLVKGETFLKDESPQTEITETTDGYLMIAEAGHH